MEKRGDAAAAGVVPGPRDNYALVERVRRFRWPGRLVAAPRGATSPTIT
jgi:hypothetical protein